ncbi:MAG TPA: alpha-hydroxy-acid oxidizing protein [Solirubrobacteraceae bacterium]|nr:alpha-hydroxy-acid oxidizing protein [Solirubrobacteraceae bacterium]
MFARPLCIGRDYSGTQPTLTWADLRCLRSLTSLPLILKGVCHPDDVRRAIDRGVDAIYCSTHGGRRANSGIGALDMLNGIVDAAGDVPVMFDSGVAPAITSSRRLWAHPAAPYSARSATFR